MITSILTAAELDARYAFTASLDPRFAKGERDFYESRTVNQLRVLAAQAWDCNDLTGYQMAQSHLQLLKDVNMTQRPDTANGGCVTFIQCPARSTARVQEQYPGAIVVADNDDSFYDVLELDSIEKYEIFVWCPNCGTAPCES